MIAGSGNAGLSFPNTTGLMHQEEDEEMVDQVAGDPYFNIEH